jgi:hypothetical protein
MRQTVWKVGLYLSLSGGLVGWPGATHRLDAIPTPSGLVAQGRYTCPTELQPLTELLVRDLPGYVNRLSQQSRRRSRSLDLATYMILAGQPEFTPLPLTLGGASPVDAGELQQVFLTTLERQYVSDDIVEIQTFHWIFLAPTQRGWRLAMMFSRIGGYPATTPPSPPRDTSQGLVAQSIQAWLRDCQSGSIRPPKPR